MRYLIPFNNFELNESYLKYDKTIIDDILDYKKTLFKNIPEWMQEQTPFGQGEIDEFKSVSKDLTLNKSKIINTTLSEFIYTNSNNIMKGLTIHKTLLSHPNDVIDESLIEKINTIFSSKNSLDLKNDKLKITIIPFLDYCYDKVENEYKEINGKINLSFPKEFKSFKDYYKDYIFVCDIFLNIKSIVDTEETLKHEMMHLTQFINTICLELYKKFSNIKDNKYLNKSIHDIYNEINNEINKGKFSVGLTKNKFVKNQDYVSSTVDVDKYMDNPSEYKPHLHDITMKYYKKSEDKKDLNKIAKNVINDKNIKMIDVPNKQKMSDIMRILYKISNINTLN